MTQDFGSQQRQFVVHFFEDVLGEALFLVFGLVLLFEADNPFGLITEEALTFEELSMHKVY